MKAHVLTPRRFRMDGEFRTKYPAARAFLAPQGRKPRDPKAA